MYGFINLRPAGLSAIVALAIALSACSETKPSRFYVLSAMPPDSKAVPSNPSAKKAGVVAIGPIEMPKYLDRPQIVTLVDPNRLDINEFDRWAEPLANSVARVMAENILAMTSAARVDVYPFPVARSQSDRQVVVQVIRFHMRPDNVIDLWANWNILDQDGRRTLASGSSKAAEAAPDGDIESVAAAMSRAIFSFSKDVANALNALPSPAT